MLPFSLPQEKFDLDRTKTPSTMSARCFFLTFLGRSHETVSGGDLLAGLYLWLKPLRLQMLAPTRWLTVSLGSSSVNSSDSPQPVCLFFRGWSCVKTDNPFIDQEV